MSLEKKGFEKCIESCQELNAIYSYLVKNKVMTLETASVLRAEYVLIVSAFDFYLHQIVCRILIETFFSECHPIHCKDSLIPMPVIQQVCRTHDESTQKELLLSAVKDRLSKDSFQSSKSVEYALGLIGVNHIWSSVSGTMGDTPERIKMQLDVIVHRRNQIAHEADIELTTGDYRAIDAGTVNECKNFISKLVNSIDSLI